MEGRESIPTGQQLELEGVELRNIMYPDNHFEARIALPGGNKKQPPQKNKIKNTKTEQHGVEEVLRS